MAVAAYLETARVLRLDGVQEFALRTLDRLLDRGLGRRSNALPRHCLSDEANRRTNRRAFPGTLDDYAFTIHAGIDAWLASGNMNFYRVAVTWPTP